MAIKFRGAEYEEIISRIHEPRSRMQIIVGPRPVGQSTLIGQALDQCRLPFDIYSADDVRGISADWLAKVWETQRMKMDVRQEKQRLLIIDEIQKIQNWSETV